MNNINKDIVASYLTSHYNEINDELQDLSSHQNFVGMFQAIINHINVLLTSGQIQKIGTKIKLIGWLYKRGNEYMKYIIENLFVQSFVGMKRRCNSQQWTDLYNTIPANLKQVYLLQNKNYSIQKSIS
ncbi:hypothetical protein [Chishuiella changwenlii]|uniref:DUF7674 family protein n=1 Tax=Chishuiella changwenlii TaxID=1434701 RepID=UPI002FD98735